MSNDDMRLRDNGTDWLHFGRAVFTSCRRIDVVDCSEPEQEKRTTLVPPDQTFEVLKEWLIDNFAIKLNLSPEYPQYKATAWKTRIEIYADEGGHLDARLLVIPLTPAVLGAGAADPESACEAKLTELRILVF